MKEKMKMAYFVCGGTKQDGVSTVDLSNSNKDDLTFVANGGHVKTQTLQGISEIETGAFRNCEAVQRIRLPVSVSEIGEAAFEGCKDLRIVRYKQRKKFKKNLVVHAKAFKDCSSLETVIFPRLGGKGTITIAKDAFSGCSSLRTIVLRGNGKFHIHPDAFCHAREVTLVVTESSEAETFAVEYGYRSVRGN